MDGLNKTAVRSPWAAIDCSIWPGADSEHPGDSLFRQPQGRDITPEAVVVHRLTTYGEMFTLTAFPATVMDCEHYDIGISGNEDRPELRGCEHRVARLVVSSRCGVNYPSSGDLVTSTLFAAAEAMVAEYGDWAAHSPVEYRHQDLGASMHQVIFEMHGPIVGAAIAAPSQVDWPDGLTWGEHAARLIEPIVAAYYPDVAYGPAHEGE